MKPIDLEPYQEELRCDPFGSYVIQHVLFPRRCICRYDFHGEHCEFISRCVSGRPRNISCAEAPFFFFGMPTTVGKRCEGLEKISICDCFPGYTGIQCEQRKTYELESSQNSGPILPLESSHVEVMLEEQKVEIDHDVADDRYLSRVLQLIYLGLLIAALIFFIGVNIYFSLCSKQRISYRSQSQSSQPQYFAATPVCSHQAYFFNRPKPPAYEESDQHPQIPMAPLPDDEPPVYETVIVSPEHFHSPSVHV
ncbi:unnamed protein product [Caenorhabditis auriculariae]|uniref:EGF-like domain-containing protein n=1 Tax=Caenorhabditis auriculariae TaxID=2777116 RepID=A0A8S1HI73_9PELO|nr:unnamed protein product [Caenorhabditis auriculariae]